MALVLHQARWALAAGDAGPHAVGCQLPQGDVLVEASAGTGWATLIKHEAAVQGTAHHAECGAPPGWCHPCLATVASIGFQGVTEAGVRGGTGPASTEVIHAGGKEGVWWHHSMAAAERGGLQHRTPGVGLTPGTVPCCLAWIHLTALGTGPTRSWALWDLPAIPKCSLSGPEQFLRVPQVILCREVGTGEQEKARGPRKPRARLCGVSACPLQEGRRKDRWSASGKGGLL